MPNFLKNIIGVSEKFINLYFFKFFSQNKSINWLKLIYFARILDELKTSLFFQFNSLEIYPNYLLSDIDEKMIPSVVFIFSLSEIVSPNRATSYSQFETYSKVKTRSGIRKEKN